LTGEIAQLISILRAGRALGAAEHLTTVSAPAARASAPSGIRGAPAADVNTEGRVCVQIGVLGHPGDPFTTGPLTGVTAIVNWLDSWTIPRRWPAGRPVEHHEAGHPAESASADASRALWALGGHFGASQVPGCASHGPGGIDTDLLTGAHIHHVHQQREPRHSLSSASLAIPALKPEPETPALEMPEATAAPQG
jgi:hypothetical protein